MAVQTSYYGYESIDYAKETLEKFVPTLFIGLGGTGKSTLMRYRKNMLDEYVKWREDFARFLVVDTDDQTDTSISDSSSTLEQVRLRRDQGEFIPCTITQQEYRLVLDGVRQRGDRRFWEWLHPDFENLVPPSALERGAGTYRQAGRLAFFLRYNAIRDQIVEHIREALRFAANPPHKLFGRPGEVYDNRLEVVIVTSLAGGTGSGMFLDMAYLVRDILQGTPDFRNITAHTTLYAVMPGIFSAKGPQLGQRFRQNAYAALLEIEHYTTPRPLNPFGKTSQSGQHGYLDRPAFFVNWDNPTGADRALTFRPWDTCYLIDNVNDSQRNSDQDSDEVYQMIADYLFLDFGNNPFSVAKRSARSNHTQLTDRLLAEEVIRKPTIPAGNLSSDSRLAPVAPEVIFENFYGCTYSSFGLSEILIDKDRILRAASYRLAYRLIEECWLSGRNKYTEQQYKSFLAADLKGGTPPVGETESIGFNQSAMKALICQQQGRNLERDISEKFEKLEESTNWNEARSDLQNEFQTLETELNPGGSYVALMSARRDELLARIPQIGPLRQRLKLLFRDRFQTLGAMPTQRLVEMCFAEFDHSAKRANDQTRAAAKSNKQLLARLDDAYEVGFPCTKTAIRLEFDETCRESRELALQRLDATSNRYLSEIFSELRNFVGSTNSLEQVSFIPLWREYQSKADFLNIILKYLGARFDETRKSARSNRKQSLVPQWEPRDYDALINETLINYNADVGPTDRDAISQSNGQNTFSWRRAEEQILQRVPTRQGTGTWTRYSVVEAWGDDYQRNRELQSAIGETLARCCQQLLEPYCQLNQLGNGNVVGYMMSLSPETKSENLKIFVGTSAPCMPTSPGFNQNLSRFRPAWRSILGCTPTVDERGPEFAAAIEAAVRQASIAVTKGSSDPESQKIHETRSVYESRLVLVRELGGIPLHAYDRLPELAESYFHEAVRQQRETCHTRWRDTFEELPDIELISSDEYDRIQMEVHSVIRGIMLQFIQVNADHQFFVQVSDSRRTGITNYTLGSRVSRVIKHACSRDDVLDFLQRQWTSWQDKMASQNPIWYAILYNGLQQTLMEFPQDVSYRGTRRRLPLQICLEHSLTEIENLLNSTPEGKSYLNQLTRRTEMDPDHRQWLAWYAETCHKIYQLCLHRISPSLPFYTVNWRQLIDGKLPTASELNLTYSSASVPPIINP